MKKLISILLLILMLLSLAACSASSSDDKPIFTKCEDFAGKSIGIIAGSSLDVFIEEKYGDMDVKYYNDESLGVAALKKGTIDAFLASKGTATILAARQEDLALFPDPLIEDNLGYAFKKGNPLCDEFSAIIDRYTVDGTLDALEDKWINGSDEDKVIAAELYEPVKDSKGTLDFFCCDLMEPMTYLSGDGSIIGYDVEMALMICRELGYDLRVTGIEFAGLLIAVQNGTADFIGGSLSITEDRLEVVNFASPNYYGGCYCIVREENMPAADIDLNSYDVTIAAVIDNDIDITEYYPKAKVIYVKNESDGLLALTSGQVDAYLEKSQLLTTITDAGVKGIHIHSDGQIGDTGKVAAAVSPLSNIPDAEGKINEFIALAKSDGTLDDMIQRWLVDKNYTMPDIPKAENPTFTVKVGTTGLTTPYSFYQDNELTGLDVELAMRFAAWLGADIEISPYDWDAIILACANGKIDYGISNLYVTAEKAESVIFSDPYDTYQMVLFVRDTTVAAQPSIFESIADSFEKTFIKENRWKLIVEGLFITIIISLGSALLGIILGSLFCLGHRSRKKWISKTIDVFCYIVSGIPALVILMIVFFVIFASSDISPVFSGIITFGLIFGITFSSIMSTAIDSVDVSQWEAAKALGFDTKGTFFNVIFPQLLKIVLPLLKGEFITMMKLTSIVGYIAIQDLTKAGDIIRARTFEAFFPLISTALVYLALSSIVIFAVGKLEIKADFLHKKARYPRGVNPDVVIEKATVQPHADIGTEVIRAQHIKKVYPGGTPLKDLNAVVYRGDVVSVIGPSGTGKSTFLRMLNRMDAQTEGTVTVFGMDTNDKKTDMYAIRRRMGMVFQSFNLFNHLNVVENVMFAPVKLLHETPQQAYENAIRLLRTVGLAEKALEMPTALSGGQKQRVAIARTLAMHPEIILFDEPTSALDPTMVGEVLDVIKGLAESGMTMIIVTHEMKFAKEVSTRVFYLDCGELYEQGTPAEVFDAPKRTRTQIFINKLKTAAITVDSDEYDYIAAEQTLRGFASKNKLSDTAADNLCALVGAVLSYKKLIPSKQDEHKLHIIAEYSAESGSVCVKFIRESEQNNVLCDIEADGKVVGKLCDSASYAYEDGKNVLTFLGLRF